VSIPNAKFVRIHFEKVDVDQMFDSLQIETPSGEVVEKVVGAKTDTYTDYITGGEAVIRLKSFMFRLPWVTAWGFKIDKVQVIY
jgi:hypothetical protein